MPGEIYDKQLIVNNDTYTTENPDWNGEVIEDLKLILDDRAERWYKDHAKSNETASGIMYTEKKGPYEVTGTYDLIPEDIFPYWNNEPIL